MDEIPRLDRSVVRKLRLGDPEPDDLAGTTPAERLRMVWPLTSTLWALHGKGDVPARLQRHVVRVIRRKG